MTRTRRNFLTHTLTDNLARQIGLQQYLPGVKRALGQILHHLDNSVGKPLLATNTQAWNVAYRECCLFICCFLVPEEPGGDNELGEEV